MPVDPGQAVDRGDLGRRHHLRRAATQLEDAQARRAAQHFRDVEPRGECAKFLDHAVALRDHHRRVGEVRLRTGRNGIRFHAQDFPARRVLQGEKVKVAVAAHVRRLHLVAEIGQFRPGPVEHAQVMHELAAVAVGHRQHDEAAIVARLEDALRDAREFLAQHVGVGALRRAEPVVVDLLEEAQILLRPLARTRIARVVDALIPRIERRAASARGKLHALEPVRALAARGHINEDQRALFAALVRQADREHPPVIGRHEPIDRGRAGFAAQVGIQHDALALWIGARRERDDQWLLLGRLVFVGKDSPAATDQAAVVRGRLGVNGQQPCRDRLAGRQRIKVGARARILGRHPGLHLG